MISCTVSFLVTRRTAFCQCALKLLEIARLRTSPLARFRFRPGCRRRCCCSACGRGDQHQHRGWVCLWCWAGADAREAESNGEEVACGEPGNAQVLLAEDSESKSVHYLVHLYVACSLGNFYSFSLVQLLVTAGLYLLQYLCLRT
jgi:hypothetical protein